MSYVCRMGGKETFDVMINVRPCTITSQDHSAFCKSCKKVYGKKGCLCVQAIVLCSEINVLN